MIKQFKSEFSKIKEPSPQTQEKWKVAIKNNIKKNTD